MAVVGRKRSKGTVYYAVNEWRGRQVSELVGTSKREAEIRDRAMKREIKDGSYEPKAIRKAVTVGEYCDTWGKQRTNASAKNERDMLRLYVLTRPWLAGTRMDETRPRDIGRLVQELKSEKLADGSRRLSEKTIANLVGVLNVMFGSAVRADICVSNPVDLEPGALSRRPEAKTEIFSASETIVLTRHHAIPWPIRVLNALCLLAGLREGEACGRRWRDLDDGPKPLAAMAVTGQYGGAKTKTGVTRIVPVHPELARILTEWATEGFELYTGRRPTPDDFIVPNLSGRQSAEHHTKSSYGHAFHRYREAAGVPHRKLHATRHTFVSLCRRGGARKDVLVRVTHNPTGDIIDGYTHFDWLPLCEAVLCLKLDAHPGAHRVLRNPEESASGVTVTERYFPGVYSESSQSESGQLPEPLAPERHKTSLSAKTRQEIRQDFDRNLEEFREGLRAENLKRRRSLLTLSEVDPDAAAPGLAVCRAYDAVLQGDAETAESVLAAEAKRGAG